ncbi:MAG: ComF family protein [Spirochaetia bacterium]
MKNSFVPLFDILAPPRCGLCGEPLIGMYYRESALCEECISRLESLRLSKTETRCRLCGIPLISEHKICLRCRDRAYAFDSHRSVFFYRDAVRTLIRAYKFHGKRNLSNLFAEYVARAVLQAGFSGLPIIPSPPRRNKVRSRGWEHVQEISRVLEKRYGYTVLRLLERKRGPEQKNLDFNGRLDNVRDHISCRKVRVPPKRVVFFDDVFTTGATCHECAVILKKAGIERVDGVTIAMD